MLLLLLLFFKCVSLIGGVTGGSAHVFMRKPEDEHRRRTQGHGSLHLIKSLSSALVWPRNPPASVFPALELQACVTTPSFFYMDAGVWKRVLTLVSKHCAR